MLRSNPFIDREDWKDNSYGILKEDYDNVLDYLEAIEEAMLDNEDDYDQDYDSEDFYEGEEEDEYY